MKNKKLVSNYAKALFEIAKSHDEIDEISKQLADITNILIETNKYSIRRHNDKIITLFNKSNLHPLVKNFLVTIIKNNRVELISLILNRYMLLTGKKNSSKYSVTIFLPEKNEKKLDYIINIIENKVDTKVYPRIIIDESLIKGAAVQINGVLIDSSFRSKINTLKEKHRIIKQTIYKYIHQETLSITKLQNK